MLPANHQKPGERRGTYYPSEHSEATKPANTLISDLQPLELWDNSFLLHKPSSLWDFAMAALANWFGFPSNSETKESACNVGDMGSIPGLGRSPGGGHGNPLQYSCLENPMDRGAWWVQSTGSQRLGHDWASKRNTAQNWDNLLLLREPSRSRDFAMAALANRKHRCFCDSIPAPQ